MEAKQYLLEKYLPNTTKVDREIWYNTHNWPKEIVTIMESYAKERVTNNMINFWAFAQ